MKEKLYEIPMNDAIEADDECPFCFIERKTERELLDFVLGSCASYMESDIREATDQAGFCRNHQKKMFDYGNSLGNGWILKTYYKKLIKEMKEELPSHKMRQKNAQAEAAGARQKRPWPAKLCIWKFGKRTDENPVARWIEEKERTCYICDRFSRTYERYIAAFFRLYQTDGAFRDKVHKGKGFCLHHYGVLCKGADRYLSEGERVEFDPAMRILMERNLERLSADVDWLIEKYDYGNRDADWKQSKDAVSRGMQKLRGGYPADPVYKMK